MDNELRPARISETRPTSLPRDPRRPFTEAAPSNESKILLEYLALLARNKFVLGMVATLGLLTGLVISYFETPLYMARASVEIQGLNGDFLNLKSFDPTTAFQDFSPEGMILTQAKIIQSDSMVERVVRQVNSRYAKDPATSKAMSDAVDYAAMTLQVRLIPDTRILELICSSPKGQIAADFANALAAEYVNQNLESRIRVTQQTEVSLQAQLGDVKARLQQAEQDLLAYAQKSNLMFTGEARTSVAEDKLRQVQEALSQAENERAAKQSQFESAAAMNPELLPSLLEDPNARDNEAKLAELRGQLADLNTYMAPTNPKIVRLKAQVASLESAVREQGLRLSQKISKDFQTVRRREDLLRANYEAQSKLVAEQSQKTIQYTILKRETDTNRALYDSLLQKVKEAGVAKAMRANNVRPLDSAKTPTSPYRPRFLRNALMGLAAGLFLAIAFVTVRERADFNIRAPGDTAARLHVPELGVIPQAELSGGELQLLVSADAGGDRDPVSRNGHNHPLNLSRYDDSTVFAEAFRATLASLLFSDQNQDHGTIVVTSAGPAEGKSTVVAHLGLAMAETERRVLLIDGDLRHPKLHNIFGTSNVSGLTGWLKSGDFSNESIGQHVFKVGQGSNLYILPAGSLTSNISNLLHSVKLPDLLWRLRQEFDAVLIDSPSMLQFPDARVLGRAAGAVIMVIRAGKTSRDTALAATQRLAEDGTLVIGTILNGWDLRGQSGAPYRKINQRDGRVSRNGKSSA